MARVPPLDRFTQSRIQEHEKGTAHGLHGALRPHTPATMSTAIDIDRNLHISGFERKLFLLRLVARKSVNGH